MKVLIVNNMAPFIWGGAEELAVHLEKNLIAAGHDSEILRIPFQWEPWYKIPSQMLMVRAFELWNVDRVIALKFPAYLIRHSHKTLWLLHQYRQAYDLYDFGQTNIPDTKEGNELRDIIRNADNESFAESRKIYTNSQVTKDRLHKYNQFDSEVLLPPLNDPELFSGGISHGYIFAGGRINSMKRQFMLVHAMAFASHDVKLVIAGPPQSNEDSAKIEELIEKYNLQGRVKLDLRFLSRSELAKYVNNANACAYIPFDEDSLGYVAMEAANAKKPIITLSDSGGVLGLVEHGVTGWVADPNLESIAEALNQASVQSHVTSEMGRAAYELWLKHNVSWPSTIERLLA